METLEGPLRMMTGEEVTKVMFWSPKVKVFEEVVVAVVVAVVAVEVAVEVGAADAGEEAGAATADIWERVEKEPHRAAAWQPGRPSLSVQGG
jgi:hypothetical protein